MSALEGIEFPDVPFPLEPSLVLLGRRGSEAHGTHIAPEDPNGIDDRDLMGICIPPAEWVLGLRTWDHAESIKGVWDVVLYDYRKFVRLLCAQNPNVIGMLWLEPEDYLLVDPVGRALIANRDVFRGSEAAYASFVGYAHAQIKKMTSGAFAGFMGAKRKALVEKYGFDAKNAAHAVRLLHMGYEYLDTGHMQVRRTWDREMLIAIKRGEWSLEAVKEYATVKLQSMHEVTGRSPMPKEVDQRRVEEIVIEAMRSRL